MRRTAMQATSATRRHVRWLGLGISNYNTLLTGEIELKSSQHAGVPSTPVQQDLYREFKWSNSAGTLVQIAFPGLYPDLTRYQAEFEQGEVNTGQGFQQWRLSAVTTAQYFAEFVLLWDPNAPTIVLSGGGTHDARAVILVKNPSAGGATIKLSLSRLELNTNGGIWEVTDVATDGMTIASQDLTSPQRSRTLRSIGAKIKLSIATPIAIITSMTAMICEASLRSRPVCKRLPRLSE
jgi:hypothetical protein